MADAEKSAAVGGGAGSDARTAVPLSAGASATLDGLRAVLNLWIMIYHSLCWMSFFLAEAEAQAVSDLVTANGYLAVDGFFVLTGFLLGLATFAGSDRGIGESYVRRFQRIVPSYWAFLGLYFTLFFPHRMFPRDHVRLEANRRSYVLFFKDNPDVPNGLDATLGFNAFFLNNLLPFGGALIYTWSLAVQFQFYLVFPWLSKALRLPTATGSRVLLVVVGACVVGSLARVFAQWHIAHFATELFHSGIDFFWYAFACTRWHVIWMGVGTAYLVVRRPRRVQALVQRFDSAEGRLYRALTWAFAVLFLVTVARWKDWFGDYRSNLGWHHAAFYSLFAMGTVPSGFIWCSFVLWAALDLPFLPWESATPSSAEAAASGSNAPHVPWSIAVLRSAFLAFVADASYWAYLLHPAVFQRFYSDPNLLLPASSVPIPVPAHFGLAPKPGDAPLPPTMGQHVPGVSTTPLQFYAISCFAIGLTLVLAKLGTELVEKPVARWLAGPRGKQWCRWPILAFMGTAFVVSVAGNLFLPWNLIRLTLDDEATMVAALQGGGLDGALAGAAGSGGSDGPGMNATEVGAGVVIG